jgi:hypothetical protein
MDRSVDNDSDQNSINDDIDQIEKEFNKIIRLLEENNDPHKYKDLLRNFYKTHNSLNQFIEYFEDNDESEEIIRKLKNYTKEFFVEENNKPENDTKNSKEKIIIIK